MQPSPSPSPTHNIISFLIYTNAMDNIHLSVLRDPPVGCVAMCAYPPESTFELSVLPIVCVVVCVAMCVGWYAEIRSILSFCAKEMVEHDWCWCHRSSFNTQSIGTGEQQDCRLNVWRRWWCVVDVTHAYRNESTKDMPDVTAIFSVC